MRRVSVFQQSKKIPGVQQGGFRADFNNSFWALPNTSDLFSSEQRLDNTSLHSPLPSHPDSLETTSRGGKYTPPRVSVHSHGFERYFEQDGACVGPVLTGTDELLLHMKVLQAGASLSFTSILPACTYAVVVYEKHTVPLVTMEGLTNFWDNR